MAYTDWHNQVAGIVCRNISIEYGLDASKSRWKIPQKVLENKKAKIQWDFQVQTDRQVPASQPDIVIAENQEATW